jgi:putative ubiquitin-RnfH superfamily antitoxin RatB of RatAB toxin-antitoxin module
MRFANAPSRFTANAVRHGNRIMSTESINVEVAYALPEKQLIRAVNVDAGTTIGAAIVQSGIMMDFPQLEDELEDAQVGIFGKIATMTTVLSDGDRVEIYRPLIADPKEVRRQRAAEGKKMKKGG